MNAFQEALSLTFDIEGGWVHHALDPGGETNFGITKHLAQKYGYEVDQLTKADAERIYALAFWKPLQLDAIAEISRDLAVEMFESGVNTGTSSLGGWRVVRWLQKWLNRYNRRYWMSGLPEWPMLGVDGLMGPKTRKALVGYMEKRRDQDGEEVLIRSINGSQLDHYKRLADAKPHRFGAFIYGWVRHRIEME